MTESGSGFEDFAHARVPSESRRSGLSVFFVWMGFILVVGSMAIGGGLGGQMDRGTLFMSVFIGNAALAVLAFLSGYIGAESGCTFNQLMSAAFPGWSWRIVSLYVPLMLIGWFAIEAAIFGNLVAEVSGLDEGWRRAIMPVSAIVFATTAYMGLRVIGRLSYFLVPIVVALGSFAIWRAADTSSARFGFAETNVDLADGIALVMSSWILSVLLCLADLTRFARRPWIGGVVGAVGIFVANSFALLTGASAAAMTGEYDPSLILASLGYIPLAIILSCAGIWSTNDNNMYSTSLNIARMFNVSRKRAVLICTLVGAGIATFNPANIPFMFATLLFMAHSVPALGGVVLGRYVWKEWLGVRGDSAIIAWIAWLAPSVTGYFAGGLWAFAIGLFGAAMVWGVGVRLIQPQRAGSED